MYVQSAILYLSDKNSNNKKGTKMSTITVSISKKNFDKGLKYAKTFGGTYNASDKTWTIPTHRNGVYNNACNALGNYGLIVVSRNDGVVAQSATTVSGKRKHDGNCPANFGGACECQ